MLSDEWNCQAGRELRCYLMSGTVRLVESEDVI